MAAAHETSTNESNNKARLAILELANMISVPMSLAAVVRLDVPNAVWQHGLNSPLSATQILQILSRRRRHILRSDDDNADNLQRLLRLLSSYGIFSEHVETIPSSASSSSLSRTYSLTEIGRTLVSEEDGGPSYGPYVLQHHQDALLRAWGLVHEAVESTATPFEVANGEAAYEYYGKRAEMNELMQRAMSGVSVPFMRAMMNGYDGFEGAERVVDVGGSAGDCLRMILEKHNHVKEGINFDLPEVVARAPHIPGLFCISRFYFLISLFFIL